MQATQTQDLENIAFDAGLIIDGHCHTAIDIIPRFSDDTR